MKSLEKILKSIKIAYWKLKEYWIFLNTIWKSKDETITYVEPEDDTKKKVNISFSAHLHLYPQNAAHLLPGVQNFQ